MDHNPDRIAVWPGYFDAKVSRRSGRRVPRDSSVLKPDLEGLFIASRALGLKKINSIFYFFGNFFWANFFKKGKLNLYYHYI